MLKQKFQNETLFFCRAVFRSGPENFGQTLHSEFKNNVRLQEEEFKDNMHRQKEKFNNSIRRQEESFNNDVHRQKEIFNKISKENYNNFLEKKAQELGYSDKMENHSLALGLILMKTSDKEITEELKLNPKEAKAIRNISAPLRKKFNEAKTASYAIISDLNISQKELPKILEELGAKSLEELMITGKDLTALKQTLYKKVREKSVSGYQRVVNWATFRSGETKKLENEAVKNSQNQVESFEEKKQTMQIIVIQKKLITEIAISSPEVIPDDENLSIEDIDRILETNLTGDDLAEYQKAKELLSEGFKQAITESDQTVDSKSESVSQEALSKVFNPEEIQKVSELMEASGIPPGDFSLKNGKLVVNGISEKVGEIRITPDGVDIFDKELNQETSTQPESIKKISEIFESKSFRNEIFTKERWYVSPEARRELKDWETSYSLLNLVKENQNRIPGNNLYQKFRNLLRDFISLNKDQFETLQKRLAAGYYTLENTPELKAENR